MKLLLLILVLFQYRAQAEHYFALSSSGGISLGNYQAGRLYYQNYFLLSNHSSYRPSIYTGASAGSINSLLSLIDICQNDPRPPQESLYWKTWIPIGFKSLIPKKNEGSPTALFSNHTLLKIGQSVKKEWRKGFKKGCGGYLGIPITLKNPDIIQINPSLSVQRQLITVVIKITGQGPNTPPTIENMTPERTGVNFPRLYLSQNSFDQLDPLISVLLSSAAFPGAFPPQRVRLCFHSQSKCTLENSKELDFIDGGIYENQPIKLAYLIKKKLNNKKMEPQFFRHVDADGRGYPLEEEKSSGQDESFMKTLMQTSLSFLDTSRNQELYSFIQEFPKIKEKIFSTVSSYPRASDPWGAFFGFFDVGFREFDFLLGVYESEIEVSKIKYPEFSVHPTLKIDNKESNVLGSWRRYACLRQFLNGTPELQWDNACQNEELKNLRILSQISLWRLYQACNRAGIEKQSWAGCEALLPWNGIPFISQKFQTQYKPLKQDQTTGGYMIEILSDMGYQFDKDEFHNKSPVDEQLRFKLQTLVDKLAERQKSDERRAMKQIGTVALNYYRYLPPKNAIYGVFGELSEFGWISRKIPGFKETDKFSFNLALEIFRGQDMFTSNDNQASIAPLFGGIYPLTGISDAKFQYSVGLAVGNIFSISDMRGLNTCNSSRNLCSGFLARPSFGVSVMNLFQINLYQRLNLTRDGKSSDLNLALGFNHSY